MTESRYPMTIALTRSEMARSWLVEHYRRQGNPPVRTVIAIGMTVMGAALLRSGPTTMAWVTFCWGLFLFLRPVAFAAYLFLKRRETKPFVVTVDPQGVNIAGAKGARLLPWKDVTAFGLGTDYLWYEIRRGPRATIPFRVMTDREGVEALFRANVKRG